MEKQIMEEMERAIGNSITLSQQMAETLKLLTQRVLELEERQNVLWKALQGITRQLSKERKGEKDEDEMLNL